MLSQVGERGSGVCCLSVELLSGVCEENNSRIPAAVPLQDIAPASCSPWEGKVVLVRDEGQFALS